MSEIHLEFEDIPLKDSDRDSIHILPLSILPLETTALRRACLIKNVRLQSVVEMFSDAAAGSGQLDIEGVPAALDWPPEGLHPDQVILRQLAPLPSFDVYSLRINLRELGIPVSNVEGLTLSESKNRELTSYMKEFTHPLIVEVYGGGDVAIQDFDDVVALFRDPDVGKAREKLELMAGKLEIRLDEVPKFLEDYGDIFLSLSYYRQCLDQIEPSISDFLGSIEDIRTNWQLRNDPSLMAACEMIQGTVNGLVVNIAGRFESFDRNTLDMWRNITAKRFLAVKALIENYHTTIGAALCALCVKMNAWSRKFPIKDAGGPMKRAEFMMVDMRQGLENIQRIENSAPVLSRLDDV
jgi:hypothetical protein